MSVIVSFGKEVRFDPMLLRLERPADLAEMETAMASGERTDLEALIEGIERGLSDTDPERPFVTKVIWAAKMEPGQEIFPSQEYLRDDLKGKPRYKDVSRVLAKLRTEFAGCMIDQASMHSQKIGAALRHIDIWHDSDSYDVIPVNPYGGIQETGEVLRGTGTKTSFYDIRKKADVLLNAVEGAESAAGLTGEAHFVMANLVRGGVFGSSTKKAEEKRMNGSLNSGAGMCQGNARLLIKPVRAVIELGAAADVHLKTLKAVHHVNRHCSTMDYTAVAFPAMRMGRNCMLSGHEIELIGSGHSLSRILKHDNVAQLKRRGMLIPTEVTETFMAAGETGAAYVRDRACEKRTPGWIRRSRGRAERRGKTDRKGRHNAWKRPIHTDTSLWENHPACSGTSRSDQRRAPDGKHLRVFLPE